MKFTPANIFCSILLIALAFMLLPQLNYIYPVLWVVFIVTGVAISANSDHSGNLGASMWLTTLNYLTIPAAVGLIYIISKHI